MVFGRFRPTSPSKSPKRRKAAPFTGFVPMCSTPILDDVSSEHGSRTGSESPSEEVRSALKKLGRKRSFWGQGEPFVWRPVARSRSPLRSRCSCWSSCCGTGWVYFGRRPSTSLLSRTGKSSSRDRRNRTPAREGNRSAEDQGREPGEWGGLSLDRQSRYPGDDATEGRVQIRPDDELELLRFLDGGPGCRVAPAATGGPPGTACACHGNGERGRGSGDRAHQGRRIGDRARADVGSGAAIHHLGV